MSGEINMAKFNEAFDLNFEEVNSKEYKIKKLNRRMKRIEKNFNELLSIVKSTLPKTSDKLDSIKIVDTMDKNKYASNIQKINKYEESDVITSIKNKIRELEKNEMDYQNGPVVRDPEKIAEMREKTQLLHKNRLRLISNIVDETNKSKYLFHSNMLNRNVRSDQHLDGRPAQEKHRKLVADDAFLNRK